MNNDDNQGNGKNTQAVNSDEARQIQNTATSEVQQVKQPIVEVINFASLENQERGLITRQKSMETAYPEAALYNGLNIIKDTKKE